MGAGVVDETCGGEDGFLFCCGWVDGDGLVVVVILMAVVMVMMMMMETMEELSVRK